MATVGQQLTAPESGWRRYDDRDSRLQYIGSTWTNYAGISFYGSSTMATTGELNASFTFKFYGTKLRIMERMITNRGLLNITIDDIVNETYNAYSSTGVHQGLVYEKTGLSLGYHTVTVTCPSASYVIGVDAIDIDSDGYLVHPILNQVSDINTMQIGDCIPCRYTATTSGQAGYFSELGTCIADEILVTGSATPNGLFYFIKVAKGLLIADRVIQHSISWEKLNINKYIEGCTIKRYTPNLIPIMTSATSSSGSVICSGNNSDWYPNSAAEYKAFDGNNNSAWLAPKVYYGYIGYKFVNKTRVRKYIVVVGDNNSAPRDWTFSGSNDGSTWVTLDTKNNYYDWSDTGYVKEFEIINNDYYYYYRLNGSANLRDNTRSLQIQELSMFDISDSDTNNEFIVRSLSGGVAYADANGRSSLTDVGRGAWPVTNEWDKYIVNSDLNGKITKGDENIWKTNLWSWTNSTGILNLTDDLSNISTNVHRVVRGGTSNLRLGVGNSSLSTSVAGGFRPVLEVLEPNSKATTLYY